ncbi:hypothetical protein CH262_06035 [Rhodococcus sp. 05-2255-1e]|uniref:hypothetical protein n=1 Tax=Rhodococcus sp. 05-2255-1e TaxID=2022495 RepID=UPI000B9B79C4|nr:hypothetical protein [Rhodococcus sp. 05-2255-1e]OZE27548.1 hypothetical protein CH262_06035 [Rhodococcus sp. 05-2255-1e]
MNDSRIVRAVVAVAIGYSIVLAVWIGWLVDKTPPDTLPYQLAALVAGFGAALGLAMMIAGRPTREQKELIEHGVEGWATVDAIRRIDDDTAELDLEFTVPGSSSYFGKIVYGIPRADTAHFEPGTVIAVRVDPAHRERVLLLPRHDVDE